MTRDLAMTITRPFHLTPRSYLTHEQPDDPVLFMAPEILQATARHFLRGFGGLTTYAVKANPSEAVIENLIAAGIFAFDVASPAEIALIRSLAPGAALHYNNPVRSTAEIAMARAHDVCSYSVDDVGELSKLLAVGLPADTEISVRFKLPLAGAAYDFGAKFGASPDAATTLLQHVAQAGLRASLTFHPGTQCTDPATWRGYIEMAARIARAAGVSLYRLNVGGGFPAHRLRRVAPDLDAIFAEIAAATHDAFGDAMPRLVCEPGRAMVAEAVSLALRVKSLRNGTAAGDQEHVYLNDGIYGALAEQPIMGMTDRVEVFGPCGTPRSGLLAGRTVWGPTCDSLDRMPGTLALPRDMVEGDYVMVHGMGAYSTATVTRFNGYGGLRLATVRELR